MLRERRADSGASRGRGARHCKRQRIRCMLIGRPPVTVPVPEATTTHRGA
jgi:hypothetical protein